MARRRILAGALALSVIPSCLASGHHVLSGLHRRQTVPTKLPGNWTSKGCFTDNTNGAGRSLTGASFTDTTAMTVESCISFCDAKNFILAGVEFAVRTPHCDNFLENGAVTAPLTDCNMACKGNAAETCGAGNRLNVFTSGKTPPPKPSIPAAIGNWKTLGCYSDNVNGVRSLPNGMAVTGVMTLEACTSACFAAGYPFSGAEFADECCTLISPLRAHCGTVINANAGPTPTADCNMDCAGNAQELCGGPNRLTMYNYTGTDRPTGPVGGGGGAAGGGGGTTTFKPVTDLPAPWAYVGCFVDNAHGRIVVNQLPDNTALTIEACVSSCKGQGFSLAAAEFGLIAGATTAPDSDCNMACGGNSTYCGAGNRMSVYSTTKTPTILPVPVPQTTGIPGSWTYQGCLMEAVGSRAIPWQNIYPTNNSATTCLSQCAEFGYTVGGMEYGQECYCGDLSDVQAAGVVLAPEADCNLPCPGDPIHLCGAGNRIQYYNWTGPPPYVWNTPTNIGRYEALVVPLIATVGINGKVTFLEKSGTSEFANSTGAYELDLSLVNQFDKAWRTLHLKSDVFCSGSVTLPDKAGRILNVGGWSLDSTKGVRLYTPSGSAGVNGTTDWEENFQELALQRQRWYPTAAVLGNGSVLVIGGETGSNASPQPNLEILPKPAGGDTVIDLDWLARTDPYNLYPFVFVLPSGNIFVIYYNEARILDPHTFNTVKQLPNLPGSVNNFLAGRTYPLEGAAVVFPQHAPYTDPVTVMTCGGSTIGAGLAVDNCVSIQPEAANPTWTLERMPSKRVMPCMAPLPDGTFMIMNGAHQGVAGFGLASDPNLQALLYDPTQPVGQRISKLNSTIVARLYHSEAILLPDARVLVSGSDPQTPNFPEEMRIEAYIPPYLNQGRVQPSFTIATTDWAYGSSHPIVVTLHQGTTSTMKVSLVAAVSSTHGNTMGARTIFPTFSCASTTCTITAPPNAFVSPPGWHQLFILDGPTPSHSAWVRIGGDPSSIGNWPPGADFTRPGV
ncbi:glyoxal oxidase N-terminus-domain-containing protein [Mycena pura]|uniref:Glyoxal oxidase N-terminus-domain-containing protein n=1 Tax=Mycena pura TaxID=153505 RepID=A0AAD6Y8T1_9AGAR|nr:glyoxal oxidase N-terminus-domain-containing protein [Mycena pura]